MAAAARGTFTRKTSRQLAACTSQPPRNGPSAPATPPSPDQAPMARERSSGRKEASRMASEPGVSSAPPTPCSALAATRAPMPGASPQRSEATANQPTPKRNTRLRPSRSPSEPPSRRNAVSGSAYASTVHCRPAAPAPKVQPMCGKAMFTTVMSTKASADPSTVASSTQRAAGVP